MRGEELRTSIIERNYERARSFPDKTVVRNVTIVVPLVDSDTVDQTISFVTSACRPVTFAMDAEGVILVRQSFVDEMREKLHSIPGAEGSSLRVVARENKTMNARAWKQARLRLRLDIEQVEKLLAAVHDLKFVPDVYIDEGDERK